MFLQTYGYVSLNDFVCAAYKHIMHLICSLPVSHVLHRTYHKNEHIYPTDVKRDEEKKKRNPLSWIVFSTKQKVHLTPMLFHFGSSFYLNQIIVGKWEENEKKNKFHSTFSFVQKRELSDMEKLG